MFQRKETTLNRAYILLLGVARHVAAATARRFLAGLCLLLIACAADAAGTMQWTVSLKIGQNTYGGGTYATKAAAIAAMQALDSNTAEGALLTDETVLSMSPAQVKYQYTVPPVLATFGTATYVLGPYLIGGNGAPCPASDKTSESAALNCTPVTGGYCDLTQVPDGDWTVIPPSPPIPNETLAQRNYQVTDGNLASDGTCVAITTNNYAMTETRPDYCPAQYTTISSGGPPICTDPGVTGYVTGRLLDCPKNGSPSTDVGDPCDVSTGDLSQTESDYAGPTLLFERYYHSASLESGHALGVGWTHNYARSLLITNGVPSGLVRPDGHHDALSQSTTGVWISLAGDGIHVTASSSQWIAYLSDGTEEVYSSSGQHLQTIAPSGLGTTLAYNSNGQLISVSDAFGHSLQFGYNANNQISTVTEPDGSSIVYGYDTHNNLTTATYPDQSVRTYQYTNSSFPNNLTGILDEQNQQFLTVSYDPNTAAVTSSYQGGAAVLAQLFSLTYSANQAVATDALGATHTYTFTANPGYSPRASSLVINGLTQTYAVTLPSTDVQQRVTQYTDANNNITTYAYDANHLTSKTEAQGAAVSRTITYPTYQDTLTSLPTLVVEPLRQTAYAYYPGSYQLHTKTITDTTVTPTVSRTWTYTYTSSGQVQTVDGPRTDVSDVTTYTYYSCSTGNQCGQIETIRDALGHVVTYNTYNGHGQPLTITDPNGVLTTLTYDARQRVLSSTTNGETTGFSYYPSGLLKQVTLPDGSDLSYVYDSAHRLTQISDGLGNKVVYTLDAMSNRTGESAYDPSGTLHRAHTRVINALNQVYQEINAAGTAAVTTTFTYDSNGNRTVANAPLSRTTHTAYDALNRVSQITDPANGVTVLSYDANDKPVSLTDPRGLVTSYTNDGFGEVVGQASPDSGVSTKTYDAAANLSTSTDARGAAATYTNDALNRVTRIAYSDQTINFTYDSGTNGIGRLTGASDANHSMSWAYDALGRVTGKSQTVNGVSLSVGYSWANGNLTSLVTPSGNTITFGYTNHRITSVKVGSTTVVNNVTYDPFGPANGWTWSNGAVTTKTFDQDGMPSTIITPGLTANVTDTYTVDAASRITGITDSGSPQISETYYYDSLDRLTSGVTSAQTTGFTYDANSNRLTSTGPTAALAIDPHSNRITAIGGNPTRTYSYDAAGNTTGYTGATFTFNGRGRMSSATVAAGTTNYVYNALGQLIQKSGNGGTTLLVYNEAGHLLGEYSSTGALIQETVWMDNTPVATLRPNGSPLCTTSSVCIFYVHTDHLGAPRKVEGPLGNGLEWRWDPHEFGASSPQQTITYNLRFPGQYYLPETGLFYNNFRDYDPATGRYIESDPIGLNGGVNTYAYVDDNALWYLDPMGLCKKCGVKKGPEYNHQGTVPQGTLFSWNPTFRSDGDYDPKCCEVRQFTKWNKSPHKEGGPPHEGFAPPEDQPNTWYEDRDAGDWRYGHRSGQYHNPAQNNAYGWHSYYGDDLPHSSQPLPGFQMQFQLKVFDVCNGGQTIYTSKILSVDFGAGK